MFNDFITQKVMLSMSMLVYSKGKGPQHFGTRARQVGTQFTYPGGTEG